MSDEDGKKMEEIRKFSAIYGRFDAKRKQDKPLTLHEVYTYIKMTLLAPSIFFLQVSVNEAAAQICRQIPAMLTRRDELFPLARQVVRDSGYQYSKGHSRYWVMQCVRPLLSGIFPGPPSQYQTSCSTETRGPSSG